MVTSRTRVTPLARMGTRAALRRRAVESLGAAGDRAGRTSTSPRLRRLQGVAMLFRRSIRHLMSLPLSAAALAVSASSLFAQGRPLFDCCLLYTSDAADERS